MCACVVRARTTHARTLLSPLFTDIGPADFKDFPEPELLDLMEVVGVDCKAIWRDIGEGLGIDKNALDAIQVNASRELDLPQACMRMVFTRWHDGMTSEYSWRKLAKVLCSRMVNRKGHLETMHTQLKEKYNKC